jgi:integrase
MTIREAFRQLEPVLEPDAARLMRRHLDGPLRALADRRDVTIRDVQVLCSAHTGARSSLDRYLSTLRTLWGVLVLQGAEPLPFSALRKPRGDERAPMVALDRRQVADVAEAAGCHYGPIIRFLAYTGLRFGELAALEPAAVMLEREGGGKISVCQAQKRDGRIGDTKTHRRRVVHLLDPAYEALFEYLDQDRTNGGRWLFQTHTGRQLHNANWNQRVWRPACQLAGVPVPPGANPLRHVFASLLINQAGAPPAFVARQMGHRDATITQQVYAHWYAADDQAIVNRLNEALR